MARQRLPVERLGVASVLCLVVSIVVCQVGLTWIGFAAGRDRNPSPAAALVGALVLAAVTTRLVAVRLPVWITGSIDGAIQRRRGIVLLWLLSALAAVIQTARLSTFMTDPGRVAAAAVPMPGPAHHACMAAYFHAADLSRRRDVNIYEESHYPAFSPEPHEIPPVTPSPVDGLGAWIDDPFEYPPPFLLLPRFALALTNHYVLIRAVWYAVQSLGFIAVALWFAAFVGGRAGMFSVLLLPLLWVALPMMFGFQFGQYQLASIGIPIAGMMLFTRARAVLGGALLASSIVAKIFPGVLTVYLLVCGRRREVAWTLALTTAIVVLSLLVLGPTPFADFLGYQLPRIASGEAFRFFLKRGFTIANNLSPYGIVFKLERLGIAGIPRWLAGLVAWLYTGVVIALAVIAARRPLVESPAGGSDHALRWLALLNLAALRSPLAPASYVPASSLWLLTFVCAEIRGRRRYLALAIIAWIFLHGFPPLPSDAAMMLLAFVSQAFGFALNAWIAIRAPAVVHHGKMRPPDGREPSSAAGSEPS